MTREEWLENAIKALTPLFDDIENAVVPPLRISIGWPHKGKPTTRGQCFKAEVAKDGVSQIFISPWVEEPVVILGVILHEMIHGIDNCDSGHRGNFIRLARAVGLEPKWTSANPSLELLAKLVKIEADLGEWPHSILDLTARAADQPAKQSTRMLKVVCSVDGVDGYKVRMTRKWLDELGAPDCPCHHEQMEEGA
jgi:hypothetical protein